MIDINSIEDLPNYIFFSDDGSNPKQVNPNDDILKSLRYSSTTEIIDETKAIKMELLAEIGSILGQFSEDTKIENINTIIKQARGNNNSLFNYTISYPNIRADIKSKILNVKGLPIEFKKGDNINDIVENQIQNIL